jgi:hypothetical protein
MRIVAQILLAGAAIALAACASSGPYSKTQSGAPDWETANAGCQAKAAETPPSPLRHLAARHTYDECLRALGWTPDQSIPHRHYRR